MPPVKRARVVGFSNGAVLGELLEQYLQEATAAGQAVKDLFELKAYSDLQMNGTPDAPSLAGLEAVLRRLLSAAPSASLNQRAMEKALRRLAERSAGLACGAVVDPRGAAIAHCLLALRSPRPLCATSKRPGSHCGRRRL